MTNLSWSTENSVNYYRNHRGDSSSLYRSERGFLEEVTRKSSTVLDIGCAAGGFSRIVREFNPGIAYSGADLSERMIEEARMRFPGDDFRVTDGERLDYPDSSFDAAICFGVLHMALKWKELLAEGWRVCRNDFVFDVRLTSDAGVCDPLLSHQKLEFEGEWDGVSTAPYIVVNVDEFRRVLAGLSPSPAGVRAYGYQHPVSHMNVTPYTSVCMAAFHLSKDGSFTGTDWQLPL